MAGPASSDRLVTTFPLLETADMLQQLSLGSDANEVSGVLSKGVYHGNGSLERKARTPYSASASHVPASLGTRGSQQTKALPNGGDLSSLYPWGYLPSGSQYKDMVFAFDHNSHSNTFSHYMNSDSSRRASSFGQPSFGYIDHLYPNHVIDPGYPYGSSGYDSWKHGRGWYPVDGNGKTRSSSHGRGFVEEKPERLNELCRGPRSGDYKNQQGFQATQPEAAAAIQDTEEQEGESSYLSGDPNLYNGDTFPETYSKAKFFVIKSYSEDDVHKSIKYGVWSSTLNGNKKLDAAYREAKENPEGCPVFLLFSVNASGQFVGLAEMVGPVDFNKTVEYWQQDKWIGCFPVKWHIVKDVPNSLLRHITLENNENKPVTNSRDTQEVNLENGTKIIKIFKEHTSKTCILDDFGFYEARAMIIHEKKKTKKPKKQALDGAAEEMAHLLY
ncbi:PREDICTED: YTH domain-containing protein 1 [Tarenaya hassleriana]|uniref:YTH domain-containing protein 1 n=1 Tax=Tarenaya hassleriana TaxID=28532 RepID=UPI00053C4D0C|nr:PREDICTED: YTH domain-containing protein 1 [Tarenaya hassleriana]